jgi:glyoxylase-like metal-dependent hydrolase (beta-lactamase superfamily II)
VLVDPAWDHKELLATLDRRKLTLRGIVLTHSHSDHAGGVELITQDVPVPVYMMRREIEYSGFETPGLVACEHEQCLTLGAVKMTCLHTPGHTRGSACFWADQCLFTGDTLFLEGCGRCHLPGGSSEDMYQSIAYLKANVPEQTSIYPGHKYGSEPGMLMGLVRRRNVYLRFSSKGAFVEFSDRHSRSA